MKVAIAGLPAAGKTTLFGALTRQPVKTGVAGYGAGPSVAVVEVPDPRVDALVEMFHPRKVARASVEFVDGGAPAEKSSFGAEFLQLARASDALALVVRAFESELVPRDTPLDPQRDLSDLEAELILADLALIETRLERLEKQARGAPKGQAGTGVERDVLRKIQEHLEQELPLRALELPAPEQQAIRHLEFLTGKPVVIVPNIGEADLAAGQDLNNLGARSGSPVVPICGAVELEVAQLGSEEEIEFLAAMGVSGSGRDRLIRQAYELLGLISFFTVGEDEVKAWTIRRGDTALIAAGKIHSDLARGFIRAEVIPYAALAEAGGPRAAKEQGRYRLEQKPYVVADGDILNIRFSV